jgi:hypothetical protein
MFEELEAAKTDSRSDEAQRARDEGTATPTEGDASADLGMRASLSNWRLIDTRRGETYSWPQGLEEYSSFHIYESTDAPLGSYAIAKVDMGANDYWGGRRPYFVVFRLGAGRGSKQPIVVFVAADDYETTRAYIAVVRGAGGPRGQRMFDTEAVPAAYDNFEIVTFRDRIAGTTKFRGYVKAAVLAHEEDPETMLRHGAIQVALRPGRD